MKREDRRILKYDMKTSGEIGTIAIMMKGVYAMFLASRQDCLCDELNEALVFTAGELADRLSDELQEICEGGTTIFEENSAKAVTNAAPARILQS